jgi:RNA polymerase sigma-70 factor (ECF subfamily)
VSFVMCPVRVSANLRSCVADVRDAGAQVPAAEAQQRENAREASRNARSVAASQAWMPSPSGRTEAPEDETIAHLRGEDAARRIAELLPAEQAEIVLLRIVGGFSVDEVARVVGRPPGTVRVLQHRALRRLAAQLGET